MSHIYDPIVQAPLVVCDFGWYYGSVGTPERLPEVSFAWDGHTYPPGATVLATTTTLPTSSITVASTSTFDNSGVLMIWQSASVHTLAAYTVTGSTTFSVEGGSGTFLYNTPVFDPRFYIDSLPLSTNVIFDCLDGDGLGLPTLYVPEGVHITSYRWDFGNGTTAYGSNANTEYTYSTSPPSVPVSLTVVDNLGRTASCMHRVRLIPPVTLVEGTVYREGAGRTT